MKKEMRVEGFKVILTEVEDRAYYLATVPDYPSIKVKVKNDQEIRRTMGDVILNHMNTIVLMELTKVRREKAERNAAKKNETPMKRRMNRQG